MVMQVLPAGKPKSIWTARVNVAVELKEQQQGTGKHQSTIGEPRERPEIFDVLANNGQNHAMPNRPTIWPSSTPTLKDSRRVTNPVSGRGKPCTRVASPRP